MSGRDQSTGADLHREVEAKLLEIRAKWERRLAAIQADRRRESDPLVSDSDDQAIQRENDAPLDALDERGRRELEAVEAALQRLAAGTFERCVRCGATISSQRLRAQPTASTCLRCAQQETGH